MDESQRLAEAEMMGRRCPQIAQMMQIKKTYKYILGLVPYLRIAPYSHTSSSLRLCASVVPPPSSHRDRGSAMTEMVLVLPLILVVLSLLLFFGLAMTRLQRSSVTDRYEAWRQTLYAPGPGAEFEKLRPEFGDAGLLNEAFFADNADGLTIEDRSGRVTVDAPTDTVAVAAELINEGSDALIYEQALRSPAWWRIDLATEHTSSVPLYQRFAGPVRHQHTRIDGDWAFASWIEQLHRGDRIVMGRILTDEAHFIGDDNDSDGRRDLDDLRPQALDGIYEVYYRESDEPFELLQAQGNPLADAVRGIYLNLPGYVGPQLLPELAIPIVRYVPNPNPDAGQPLQ